MIAVGSLLSMWYTSARESAALQYTHMDSGLKLKLRKKKLKLLPDKGS